jgi:short-subunit dehydrogenase
MSAESVARQAVDAAAHGKRAIVPGLLNRAGAITGQHAPRVLALPIV